MMMQKQSAKHWALLWQDKKLITKMKEGLQQQSLFLNIVYRRVRPRPVRHQFITRTNESSVTPFFSSIWMIMAVIFGP